MRIVVARAIKSMYNWDMPTEATIEKETRENGEVAEKLHIEITNGALAQLKDLAKFYKIQDEDPLEIIQLGISMLELMKKNEQRKVDS